MYYHRVIVNFKKTATAPYFLHLFVDIEKNGNELGTYPANWIGNYTIAYGILGSVSNIDADKVYDYHTAITIQPTKMVMNVDLDMNNKKLLNFKKKKKQFVILSFTKVVLQIIKTSFSIKQGFSVFNIY